VRPEGDAEAASLREAGEQKKVLNEARLYLQRRQLEQVQTGKLGVDLSIQSNNLRNQNQLTRSAVRRVQNRNCLEIGGVWIDEGFTPKLKTVVVKAMSKAYFRMLERHPEVRDVFRLGNHLVWVAPNGDALVVDTNDGREEMSDADIDRLFTRKK
jgi:Ca-activated chloride channel family protein